MSEVKTVELKDGHLAFYLDAALTQMKNLAGDSEQLASLLEATFIEDEFEIGTRVLDAYVSMLSTWSKAFAVQKQGIKVGDGYEEVVADYFAEQLNFAVLDHLALRDAQVEGVH